MIQSVLELDASARSSAPPEPVWELLADVRTWPSWADFDEAEVESGAGLGEVRAFRSGRVRTRERMTAFEPPRLLAHELLSGLPIRHYRAEVTLAPLADGGTDIRWRSTLRPALPGTGWAIRRRLQRFLEDAVAGLARAAAAG